MTDRMATVQRETKETRIELTLNLDGTGRSDIATGAGFFDHMLSHIARHGLLDLTIKASGDQHVDDHHLVEDVGIVLGQALAQAVGDKRGISRFGHALCPLDEALVGVALDLSGRSHLEYGLSFPTQKVGGFDTELFLEFFRALAANAAMTLHLWQQAGRNSHHIAESAFKSLGRALRMAVEADERQAGQVPSTKGVL
ncbi:MAG: imidazoleglycerol-phosphate dehydratase HisB [Armatimonadetes bacterium]|nr:imidazoleglycerol-phosphate dehydratase HisB [Armatimonadota bacterium]